MRSASKILLLSLTLMVLFAGSGEADITIFASGLEVPESISLAPSGFGSHGGQFIVPDPGFNNGTGISTIYSVPSSGGIPSAITSVNDSVLGGIFIPLGFGQLSGQYLFGGTSSLYTMGGSGAVSQIADTSGMGFFGLTGFVQAPSGFGPGGGNIFITAQDGPDPSGDGGVLELGPSGQVSVFQAVLPDVGNPFGLIFANGPFGAFSNQLLVSDGSSGNIDAVSANGTISKFATLPLADPSGGLRQMAFVPQGYGALGGDLLVSVSGSQFGGGQLGALYALNSSGTIVAALDVGSTVNAFDPRGLYFLDNNNLLVSDASDPILDITPNSFLTVPEPSATLMIVTSLPLLGLGLVIRQLRARPTGR